MVAENLWRINWHRRLPALSPGGRRRPGRPCAPPEGQKYKNNRAPSLIWHHQLAILPSAGNLVVAAGKLRNIMPIYGHLLEVANKRWPVIDNT